MKKCVKRILIPCSVLFVVLGLLCILSGCGASPMSTKDVARGVEELEGAMLTVYENPAADHMVVVTKELSALLDLEHWEPRAEITHDTNDLKMLYFDLYHEDEVTFSRVVIFSDATAFIQLCDKEFGEKQYYQCSDTEVFSALVTYINEHFLEVETAEAPN